MYKYFTCAGQVIVQYAFYVSDVSLIFILLLALFVTSLSGIDTCWFDRFDVLYICLLWCCSVYVRHRYYYIPSSPISNSHVSVLRFSAGVGSVSSSWVPNVCLGMMGLTKLRMMLRHE